MAKKRDSTSNSAPPKPNEGRMVLRTRKQRVKEISAKPPSELKPKATSNKKNSKVDAFKPKKPPTAFFYFLEDFRKEFQESNPDIKSMREIGKVCGDKWKAMNYEEKVAYYDIATEKRAEFDEAMADYNKRKEMGEFLEYEEDSDF